MKEESKFWLVSIRDELQSFIHDEDINSAFECAFWWWKDYCVRHKLRTYQFFYNAWKRGWMTKTDAESFCFFIHSGRYWRCLE